MEKVKRAGCLPTVSLVEHLDAGPGLLDQYVTLRHVLSWRVGEICQQAKVQMRILVAQEVQLQLSEQ